MAVDYATVANLQEHWPGLPDSRLDEAGQKLHEASIEVRALYPDVDRRVVSGELDPDVPRLVVCRMVKRSMDSPLDEGMAGVGSTTAQTGPFSQTLSFTNPDGNIYLSKADRRLLESGRRKARAWTIHPGGW